MPQGRGEEAERGLSAESLRHIGELVAGIAANGPRRSAPGRGPHRGVRYEEEDA